MTTYSHGETVTLKPQRADAYGLPRGTRLTVSDVFTKPGYKAQWVRVVDFDAPLNVFRASDFR